MSGGISAHLMLFHGLKQQDVMAPKTKNLGELGGYHRAVRFAKHGLLENSSPKPSLIGPAHQVTRFPSLLEQLDHLQLLKSQLVGS